MQPLHALAGEPPGAEGGLKVVTPDWAVEVEDFSGQVQIWRPFALHRTRVNVRKRHAAGGHLGLLEPQRTGDRDRRAFERPNERRAFRSRQLGEAAARPQRPTVS